MRPICAARKTVHYEQLRGASEHSLNTLVGCLHAAVLQPSFFLSALCYVQRKVAEAIIAAWDERLPKLEPLCRMLLVADRCLATTPYVQ